MRFDRKIADVCAVVLEEMSFFDLFTATFPLFCYITRIPDFTSLLARSHLPMSPIFGPRFPDLASSRPRSHVPTRPLSRVTTQDRERVEYWVWCLLMVPLLLELCYSE